MSKIYSQAMKVIAWTGLEEHAHTPEELFNIEQVFNLAKDRSGSYRDIKERNAAIAHNPGLLSIARLCEVKYWSRLWIVQNFFWQRISTSKHRVFGQLDLSGAAISY